MARKKASHEACLSSLHGALKTSHKLTAGTHFKTKHHFGGGSRKITVSFSRDHQHLLTDEVVTAIEQVAANYDFQAEVSRAA